MADGIALIGIDKLLSNPDNPRKNIGDVSELAESIQQNGIMQNLTVFPSGDKYMILIGHRRFNAAMAAGLQELPCKVIEAPTRAKQIEIMLEENMQRNDLTPIEEADSFQLCLDLGETVEDLQKKTGFSESTIRRRLAIAKLDKKALAKHQGEDCFQLSLTDLYELERIKDVGKRNEVLENSQNSAVLRNAIENAVREQGEEEYRAAYIKLLEEKGIKELPKKLEKKMYTPELKSVATYYFSEAMREKSIPKKIKLPKKEDWVIGRYYYGKYAYITLYDFVDVKKQKKAQKEAEATRELTPYEIKQKKIEQAAKNLGRIKKDMMKEVRQYVLMIIEGRVVQQDGIKDDELIIRLWNIIRNSTMCVDTNYMYHMYTGSKADSRDEELVKTRNETFEYIKSLPIKYQLLLLSAQLLSMTEFCSSWNAQYRTPAGPKAAEIINVLRTFGFVLKEEYESLINGKNENYQGEQSY
ncbi:MAG: ParB/RepB/Spo0J family partition protein [Lachnospiraceae bacterium]|nr:ParB/RepB/Spo0J family partition protein [Lachnospiraceae bacterium]